MPETRGLCLSEEQTVNTVSSTLSCSWLIEFKKLIVCTALNAICHTKFHKYYKVKTLVRKFQHYKLTFCMMETRHECPVQLTALSVIFSFSCRIKGDVVRNMNSPLTMVLEECKE